MDAFMRAVEDMIAQLLKEKAMRSDCLKAVKCREKEAEEDKEFYDRMTYWCETSELMRLRSSAKTSELMSSTQITPDGEEGGVQRSYLDLEESYIDVQRSYLESEDSLIDVQRSYLDLEDKQRDVQRFYLHSARRLARFRRSAVRKLQSCCQPWPASVRVLA